jgi:SAM-dependent methyltransferase
MTVTGRDSRGLVPPPREWEGGDMSEYFSGAKLYGDDFGPEQLRAWFEDEEEGFAEVEAEQHREGNPFTNPDVYPFHALNIRLGFSYLPAGRFEDVLGIGSARAQEFAPLAGRIGRLTVVEPSDQLSAEEVDGVPVRYVKPSLDGALPFEDRSFDLITCFGVLHHIANVSRVVGELGRCLRPGGYALVRETITSMGDWRGPRRGLTKRERGIPIRIFRRILADAGFGVVAEHRCMFSLVHRLGAGLGLRGSIYNSHAVVGLDQWICRLFAWNHTYHATGALAKLRAQCVFYVLTKP